MRGVLYPEQLPTTFVRLPPPAAVAELVRWFWIPEWDVPDGQVIHQDLLAYPATNLVVEREFVGVSGLTTVADRQELHGVGWAVGALLRPAAVPDVIGDPLIGLDAYPHVEQPELHAAVSAAMACTTDRHERAVAAFAGWLAAKVPVVGAQGRLANAMAEVIETDPELLTVEDVAARLGVSARTVQRLAKTYVGLSPLVMIRRRRLQEAAQRVREDPSSSLADLAAELGYADHAHLTREFTSVLGFTPSRHRAGPES